MRTERSQYTSYSVGCLFSSLALSLVLLLSPFFGLTGALSADEDPPVFLKVLGTYGAAVELFRAPNDVAVDSNGSIYVADTMNHRVQMFDGADWITIGGDGEIGTAAGEFNQPRGVAVDSGCNVYVADRVNHRVQMFDGEEWTVIGGDGEVGTDPGEFHLPMGVALDMSGTLYVTDGGNHRIQAYDGVAWTVFAGTTGVIGTDPGEFSFPIGIAVNPTNDEMYVTDFDNNRVQAFDGADWSIIGGGATVGTELGEFDGPVRVAVDEDGDAYVSDLNNHRVQVYDGESWALFAGTTGISGTEPGKFARPTGVAVGTDGCVYVAELDNNRIQLFDSGGAYLMMWDPGPEAGMFNQPWGVALDSSGDVYVADRNNHRIQRYDGSEWSIIGGNGAPSPGVGVFNMPMGVAADPTNGDLYVADSANQRIQKYDGTGWTVIGGDGSAGTDPGQFNSPRGVAVDTDSNVYVADVGNHRVQMYDGMDWTVIGGDGLPGTDPGQFSAPARVAVGTDSNVFVADTSNHRVQVFDGDDWTVFAGTTGSASSDLGEFDSPTGVAVDHDGNVYVAERGNNRIQKFDSEGVFLSTWGTSGSQVGQFAAANDVALGPNGDIYVADTCPFETCNHRIQVFTYPTAAHLTLEPGWNLISVPFVIGDNTVATVFGETDIGPIYTWNTEDREYQELGDEGVIDPCRAYWVSAGTAQQVLLNGEPVTDEDWECDLSGGWSMVGAPYSAEPIPFGDLDDGSSGVLQADSIYCWDAAGKEYAVATGLQTGKGYWMAATDACALTITPGATEAGIHTDAWTAAAEQCADSEYYRYSLYSTRSLAVVNPEVYLQADTLWMDMISTYGGWQANYLQRDRETPEEGWWEEIGGPVNDGFRYETGDDAFDWDAIEWAQHGAAAIGQYALYDDAFTFDWLDNRLFFIWSALKGEGWAMPQSSLAELMYLDMQQQAMSPYLLFLDDGDALPAVVNGTTVTLYDPETGTEIADPYSEVVLVMDNDYVWYPLMDRDDTGDDAGLALIVDEFCDPGAVPDLTSEENSIIDDLTTGTALQTEEESAWACLFAARATNQYTWRARPLRELSAIVFPQRYAEDDGYSDTPTEQQALGMVVTEMGNRLSPMSAHWAATLRACSCDIDSAFASLGDAYLQRFRRTDEDDEWVYGDYYHCWQPNIEDKLISGLGNCVVEACNNMAALTVAAVPDWDIFLTNWWSLDESGGHVICGTYCDDTARSLSNGLFRTNDGACMHGPLWNIKGTVAEEVVYAPSKGLMAFVQTLNAASFSEYLSPFTNLPYSQGVNFLEGLEELELSMLVAQEYGGDTGTPIDDYLASLPDMEEDWPDNVFGWEWP